MTAATLRSGAIWTLLVAVLVLPCLVNTLSSIVAVVVALLLIPVLRPAGAMREALRNPAMTSFVAAFVVLTAVFVITARDPADVRFAANFLALLLAPVVYLVAREKPADNVLAVLTLALIGAGLGAGLAVVDTFILGLPRAQGVFGGPNLLPRLAIPLGFVAMGGALLATGRTRFVYYLGPAFAIVATLLAGSRGAALALPPLLVLSGIVLWRHRGTRRDLLVLTALGLAAGAAVWLLQPGAALRLGTTLASIGDVLAGDASTDVATAERQAMLTAGWEAFLASPVIGYGWAHLGTAAALADPAGFGAEAGTLFMFHNDALDFAVAGGVVGLAVWLLLLVAPVLGAIAAPRDSLRSVRLYCAGVLSLSFLVFGVTDMTFGYDVTTTLYAFLTALLLGLPARA